MYCSPHKDSLKANSTANSKPLSENSKICKEPPSRKSAQQQPPVAPPSKTTANRAVPVAALRQANNSNYSSKNNSASLPKTRSTSKNP